MNPSLSIIVANYNQGHLLHRCLQSIKEQTFQNWECIIINDGSSDNTETLVKRWISCDQRFKYFYKKNGGLSSARNLGLKKAKGDYIFLIDSDDKLVDNESLSILYDQTSKNPDVITANVQLWYDKEPNKPSFLNNYRKGIKTYNGRKQIFRAFLKKDISVIACNKLFKKKFLVKHCMKFDESIIHEDELWSMQVFAVANSVIILPNFTYCYYQDNPQSITSTRSTKSYDSLMYILKKITEMNVEKSDIKLMVKKYVNLSQFLLRTELVENKNLWKEKFSLVKRIYNESYLKKHQKKYRFSPNMSYIIIKKMNLKQSSRLDDRIKNRIKLIVIQFIF